MSVNVADIRRSYIKDKLDLDKLNPDPFVQFEGWLKDAIAAELPDPTAMCVASVDADGQPQVLGDFFQRLAAGLQVEAVAGVGQAFRAGIAGQIAGVVGREFDVHRQAELDRGGADGHQRANVAVGVVQLAFLDIARRVGGEHVIGLAEFFRQQRRQVDGAIQTLTIELAETALGLFRMAQEDQRLRAIHRLRANLARLQRQEQCTDRQQRRQGHVGAMFETFGETHEVRH